MGRKNRDQKDKRDHGLPMASMGVMDILPAIIGRGIEVTRSGEAVTIPVGPAKLMIPSGISASVESNEEGIVFEFGVQRPTIRLPFIGRIWPVAVDAVRLEGDTLTIELDGWKDYQIKVL